MVQFRVVVACIVLMLGLGFPASADTFLAGRSGEGRQIVVSEFRSLIPSAAAVFLCGGIHGKYEENTVELMQEFERFFAGHQPGVDVYVLANLNPDSFFADARQSDDAPNGYRGKEKVGRAWLRFTSRYVDLNRNFDTPSWKRDASYNGGDFRNGAGGMRPFSESESRFLADTVMALRRTYDRLQIINYHCLSVIPTDRGTVQPSYSGPWSDPVVRSVDSEMASLYAERSGYGLLLKWTRYEVRGEFLNWCGLNALDALDVEMNNPDPVRKVQPDGSTHYDRNLAAVLAIIGALQGEAGRTAP